MAVSRSFTDYVRKKYENEFWAAAEQFIEDNQDYIKKLATRVHSVGETEIADVHVEHPFIIYRICRYYADGLHLCCGNTANRNYSKNEYSCNIQCSRKAGTFCSGIFKSWSRCNINRQYHADIYDFRKAGYKGFYLDKIQSGKQRCIGSSIFCLCTKWNHRTESVGQYSACDICLRRFHRHYISDISVGEIFQWLMDKYKRGNIRNAYGIRLGYYKYSVLQYNLILRR